MTVITLNEAAKRNPSQLMRGLMLGIVTTDELAAVIPFKTFTGLSATYRREYSLPTSEFVPDSGTLATPSVGKESLVHAELRRVEGDMDVNSLADDLSSGAETAGAVLSKVKSTWRKVTEKLVTGGNVTSHALGSSADPFAAITAIVYGPGIDSVRRGPGEIKYVHTGTFWSFRAPGDVEFGDPVAAASNGSYVLRSSNPAKFIKVTLTVASATGNGRTSIEFASSNSEMDGINRLIAPSMITTSTGASGDAFDIGMLDDLINQVKVYENRAFLMNGKLINKFMAALRSTGGANPDHMKLPGYSGEVISYRGFPLLKNDWINSDESKGSATTLSSIYFGSLSAPEGLYLACPATGHDAQDIDGDPRRENVLGWRILNVGDLEGSSVRRTRIRWSGCACLGSDLALARRSEIITA